MNPFEHITKRILAKLKNDGIYKFSLENIQYIINERNFLLDLFELDWINWELIDDTENNKDEISFRDDMYSSIKEGCKESGFNADSNDLDKIFRYEDEIVFNQHVNYYYSKFIDSEHNRDIPFSEMDFKKKFKITKWTTWKNTIDKAIWDFYEQYDILPNMLVANKHTLSQFNFLINSIPGEKEDVFRYDKDLAMKLPIDEEEEVELTGYESGDCTLYFWFDERLKDKHCILDYNDDLNWNDDDEDDDDNDNQPVLPTPSPEKAIVTV